MSEKEIEAAVKSCIVSRKGGVLLDELNDEYKALMGQDIPYSRLGYTNLQNYISSIKTIKMTKTNAGKIILNVCDRKTAHLSALVNSQKSQRMKYSRAGRGGIRQQQSRTMYSPPNLSPFYKNNVGAVMPWVGDGFWNPYPSHSNIGLHLPGMGAHTYGFSAGFSRDHFGNKTSFGFRPPSHQNLRNVASSFSDQSEGSKNVGRGSRMKERSSAKRIMKSSVLNQPTYSHQDDSKSFTDVKDQVNENYEELQKVQKSLTSMTISSTLSKDEMPLSHDIQIEKSSHPIEHSKIQGSDMDNLTRSPTQSEKIDRKQTIQSLSPSKETVQSSPVMKYSKEETHDTTTNEFTSFPSATETREISGYEFLPVPVTVSDIENNEPFVQCSGTSFTRLVTYNQESKSLNLHHEKDKPNSMVETITELPVDNLQEEHKAHQLPGGDADSEFCVPAERKASFHESGLKNVVTEVQEMIEPDIFGYQLIGDDFLLNFAYSVVPNLPYEQTRDHRDRCGLCISEQTIRECRRRVETTTLSEDVVLHLGSIEILNGTALYQLKREMSDLVNYLQTRVKNIIIMTLPPLLMQWYFPSLRRIVKEFNCYLQSLNSEMGVTICDSWHLFVDANDLPYEICFKRFPKHLINCRDSVVLWNYRGTVLLYRFLVSIILATHSSDGK